jgi:hypothetical protein
VEAAAPGNMVFSAGIFWYAEAEDGSDASNIACAPVDCEAHPYWLPIVAPGDDR